MRSFLDCITGSVPRYFHADRAMMSDGDDQQPESDVAHVELRESSLPCGA